MKKNLLPKILAFILSAYLLFPPAFGVAIAQEVTPTPETTAENSQTGPNSTNEANASNTTDASVTNTNDATVTNDVTVEGNTGGNSISPDPTVEAPSTESTPTPTGEPEGTSSDASTPSTDPTPTPTPGDAPAPSDLPTDAPATSSGQPTLDLSSTSLVTTESATVAENVDTGTDSDNSASATTEQDTSVSNTNDTAVDTTVDLNAQTGEKTASAAGVAIQTGTASASLNLANVVNTNLTGSDFWFALVNLFATANNDIDLTQIEGNSSFDPTLISVLAQNQFTGDGSINVALASLLSSFSVYNANTATLTNTVDVASQTGENTATGDGSSIQTGDASASANLFNMVNTNITGTDWFFTMINLFGGLNGDILLPYELQFLGEDDLTAQQLAAAINQNTGANSANEANASNAASLDVSNTNTATVSNNLNVGADTGGNSIVGSGSIQTGDAQVSANLLNIINTNITGSRWLLLVINNFGHWSGNVVDWWGNLITFGHTTIAWVQLPDTGEGDTITTEAINQNTGASSTNEANATNTSNLDVANDNTATVVNDVSVLADTGGNAAQGTSASIQTGDAAASANVLNVVNTNIFGNHWFLGVINIFDSLFGDIIFPRPDLTVTKVADKTTVQQGDTVTYTITVRNEGNLWAKYVVVTDTLPANTTFVSASEGGAVSGNTVTWNFFKIWPGQTKTLTLVVRVNDGLACDTPLTNTVSAITQTDEPNTGNNSASATVSTPSCEGGGGEPTPTPTPPAGGGGEGGGTGGGGGQGGGGGVGGASISVCTDPAPGSAPILLSATAIADNRATLSWLLATDPVTYYLVAYGTSSGNYQFGNPNVGGHDTISYTVGQLSGGTTYYFVVRAGNGCTPGPFSNELSAYVPGGFIAGPAEGFIEGVLGETTEEATETAVLAAEEGTVEGAATCERCLWWPFLLTELVLLLAYSYAVTRAIAIRPRIIISLAVPVLTYIFFILWNPDCLENPWLFWIIRSGSFFCKYFLLIDVGLFGLATLLWQKVFGGQAPNQTPTGESSE